MDTCIAAKNIPINESSTFNGASTGAKSAEEKYIKCLKKRIRNQKSLALT
jgi:hypothetical protein